MPETLDKIYEPAEGQSLPAKIITMPYAQFHVSIEPLPSEWYKVVLWIIPRGGADGKDQCQVSECETLAEAQFKFKVAIDACLESIASALNKVGDDGEEWDVQIANANIE